MKNILSVLNVFFVVFCSYNAFMYFSMGWLGCALLSAFAAILNLYAVINANT